ncbi:chlorophyllase-like protein [Actinocorallia herbida]|uniref:Chlorophyllase-like protein n=1 Tax=Actinocorallia herbida TaxID=58109 RepID=A0A3N1D7Z4_9ACTN|nr:alpha/beta hydrolase [Actinocorallia herbida]ROO89635.1 chlorophyllase-like protein [Actinocorallia herbida]
MRLGRTPRLAVAAALAAGLLSTFQAPASAVPVVAHYSSQVENDGADVYYPAGATGRLPVALLMQGAKVHRMYYAQYAEAIAAYGFIVVVPNHKRLVFFDQNYYPSQTMPAEAVDWMNDEDANAASPLAGKIDTDSLVLLGHSFGGAAALGVAEESCGIPFCTTLGYSRPAEVKAAALYGTNNKLPLFGTFAAMDNDIPVQLLQGTVDGAALPADAESSYGKLKNGPKQIVRIAGANHYGITNVQSPPGAEAETSTQTIGQADSIATTARWAALFLKAQLGDTAAAAYVYQTGDAADTGVTVTTQVS